MKLHHSNRILLLIFFILTISLTYAQDKFAEFFTGERLRIDYSLEGNATTLKVIEECFYREPQWGGSTINLIDTFFYGEMRVELCDSASGAIIYSRGYSTLFQEWQTTDEAKAKDSIFKETLLLPFPTKTVRIDLLTRNSLNFQNTHSFYFNPERTRVEPNRLAGPYKPKQIKKSGPSSNKLDIVMIAEGYDASEKKVFQKKAKELLTQFLNWVPYSEYSEAVNFYTLFVPSEESGVDDPIDSICINTALDCSFNTFGSDRYLTSTDMRSVYDLAANIPYDQLCILVNTPKYGGGAIYNSFTVIGAESECAEFLFLHEFGHAFASLADEYYTSSVAYEEYFKLETEPYQPNITTLIDFEHKWEDMIQDTIPIPTPDTSLYNNTIGVYEGAGYSAKGIYRPYRTCAMKDKSTTYFCPVCQRAIADMIKFYSDQK